MTGDGLKMVHIGPNMAGLAWLKGGPKGTKMVNVSVFDHLGPYLGPSGPFWTIQTKMIFTLN